MQGFMTYWNLYETFLYTAGRVKVIQDIDMCTQLFCMNCVLKK